MNKIADNVIIYVVLPLHFFNKIEKYWFFPKKNSIQILWVIHFSKIPKKHAQLQIMKNTHYHQQHDLYNN